MEKIMSNRGLEEGFEGVSLCRKRVKAIRRLVAGCWRSNDPMGMGKADCKNRVKLQERCYSFFIKEKFVGFLAVQTPLKLKIWSFV
jgi:hypothetical protein